MKHPLDNPVWHSLQSHHASLGNHHGAASRYTKDRFNVAGLARYDQAGFDDLTHLVKSGQALGLMSTTVPESIEGWTSMQRWLIPQMVLDELRMPDRPMLDSEPLTAADVPEMLALIKLAEPGPFLEKTIEFGGYIGIREEGQLVGMAGQRSHPEGFCEISAVCTHPDFRGRGIGASLTIRVAQAILARGETPFLHHAPNNEGAARLYQKLGFKRRTMIAIALMRRHPA